MPARSERIVVVPDENGQPVLIRRFPVWWNRSEFIKRYSHREIDIRNPFDVNFAFILTSGEAVTWNKECAEQFSPALISSKNIVVEDINQLESVLKNASWVIVESYE